MTDNPIKTTEPARSAAAPHWLNHALHLSVALLIAVTALAFPLALNNTALAWLQARLPARWYDAALPWLTQGYTPLLLKQSLLLTLAPVILFLFCWQKIRAQYLGEERPALARGTAPIWRRLTQHPSAWLIALLLYAGITIAWSEVFQHSLRTWLLMASGGALYLVLRSVPAPAASVRRFMILILAVGAMMAALALAQHLGALSVLPYHHDPRNRVGSLIGHNTGLSVWLLFPLAYGLYFVATPRPIAARLLTGAIVALILLVLLIAQSRSIWAIALLMLIALPCAFARVHSRGIRPRYFIAPLLSLAVVIAALSIAPSKNPLAKHLPLSITERLHHDVFNLDQLRRETRLRIAAVSLTQLFPRAPIGGTGLGSFAWEYPTAQASYFTRHPDTRLGTTLRRTEVAHNDYLQLLTETGLIGLALLGGFAWAVAGETQRRYRLIAVTHHRAQTIALIAPVIGVALHALLDFPAHVAPIALLAITSLALATPPPDDQHTSTQKPNRSSRRATLIGLAASLVIFAWYPAAWASLIGKPLQSDRYYHIGRHALDQFATQPAGTDNTPTAPDTYQLDLARRAFREAIVINVFNGEAYEGLASAHLNRAQLGLYQYQQQIAQDLDATSPQAEGMQTIIQNDAQTAIAVTENQLHAGGPRYHYTWYVVGAAFHVLAETETDAVKKAQFEKEALTHLQKAYQYNPADIATFEQLSTLLGQDAPPLKSDR